MYTIYNNIEDKIVFQGQEREFIEFGKEIAKENMDLDYSILGSSDALVYIEEYCEELEFKPFMQRSQSF